MAEKKQEKKKYSSFNVVVASYYKDKSGDFKQQNLGLISGVAKRDNIESFVKELKDNNPKAKLNGCWTNVYNNGEKSLLGLDIKGSEKEVASVNLTIWSNPVENKEYLISRLESLLKLPGDFFIVQAMGNVTKVASKDSKYGDSISLNLTFNGLSLEPSKRASKPSEATESKAVVEDDDDDDTPF